MEGFYLTIVVLLFALAITDLVVGVSNDAVNFLNSSIGSKVAPRRVIMIVASFGILTGALFSSGMMEIARKGIFNPDLFFFHEVMIIFLAVMITDIILLDLFNTFGMPTSTTVSIVFELLGATVMISLIKLWSIDETLLNLTQYINTQKATAIIMGIFLSVLIAFSIGAAVQYVSRALFSFDLSKRRLIARSLYAGLCFTALTYFLVFKGLKGASFITQYALNWIDLHLWVLLAAVFVLWTCVSALLTIGKVNVFRLIVLFGTFSLAMAFAGNDLVNFIGVPIAGFESFLSWSESGADAHHFLMSSLAVPVRTNTGLLLLAGVIMVVTLWFSKKARSVTETEVNLGRQDEGHERFAPSLFSRMIVELFISISKSTNRVVPEKVLKQLTNRFKGAKEEDKLKEVDRPAFDLVRASVNLTVASVLISLATSYKLPLSTTYVSFMVAMGTSLSDRAWDRESAVFRVSGVLNVIGGWLLTALIAFSVAALFALILYVFEIWGALFLVAVVCYSMFRSFVYHNRKERESKEISLADQYVGSEELLSGTDRFVVEHLDAFAEVLDLGLHALVHEDRISSAKAHKLLMKLHAEEQSLLRVGNDKIVDGGYNGLEMAMFLLRVDQLQDLSQSADLIVNVVHTHVSNRHLPLVDGQLQEFIQLKTEIISLVGQVKLGVKDQADGLTKRFHVFQKSLNALIEHQFSRLRNQQVSRTNHNLVLSILIEIRDIHHTLEELYQSRGKNVDTQ